ncbi:MAG: ABC-type sugar transport system ATPase subunit [Kiritimatiellia bacterium]|jgi:ABC-type sugar transport system ATPase subunit
MANETHNRPALLVAEGVKKQFGGVRALVDGAFTLIAGEVHAIMGENGAGKSTLGKILAGVFPASAGTLLLDGQPFAPTNPRQAQQLGVAMIFQELDLFPHLSIAENIVAANLAYKEGVFAKRAAMDAFCRPFLDKVGLLAPSNTLVAKLPMGDQQLVAIARALSMDARIIVMDESTSALTEDAVENLFGVIRDLKSMGVSVIYVSHKMEEIFAICDHVTVLRDGVTVGSHPTADTTMDELIRLMVGRPIDRNAHAPSHKTGKEVLRFESVSTHALRQVCFGLHQGEVLGIAGLVGSGRTEIGQALFGLDAIVSGAMWLNGQAYTPGAPGQAIAQGVGLVPEDRKTMGLMMQMSVRENATLSALSRRGNRATDLTQNGFVRRTAEAELDQRIAKSTRLKAADPRAPVSHLSGGNQQKVLLGRWLMVDPEVLFLDDPTRGVDVGAKEDIYTLIEELAAKGTSVIMVSSELPELLRCCDRILVMNQGRLVGEFDAREADQESIMHLAASARNVGASV